MVLLLVPARTSRYCCLGLHLQALVFLLSLGVLCFISSGARAGDTREADLVISVSHQVRDSTSQPVMESEREVSLLQTLCRTVTALSQTVQGLHKDFVQLHDQLQLAPSLASTSEDLGIRHSAAQTVTCNHVELSCSPEPRVPLPERFSGYRKRFRTFQNACELLPRTFSTEEVKVGFLIAG